MMSRIPGGRLSAILLGMLLMVDAVAEVRTESIRYSHQGVELEGFLAWDDGVETKRPGVLVVHEWWGLNDYARQRARQLAEQGYVAFALDMYGEGKVTKHPDQASAWMKEINQNTRQWVERAELGLDILKGQKGVDPGRLAAIGYCFGGATVMQMAYAASDVKLVGSFHGSLPVPTKEQQEKISSRVLVAHGGCMASLGIDSA